MMKRKIVYLSHILNQKTPSYGNRDYFIVRPNSQIQAGKNSNSSCWIFSNNHIGTHLDVPLHFGDKARCIIDYPASFFVFNNCSCVNISCGENYLIRKEDLILQKENILRNVELLLIRTGFELWREKEKYWRANPGLHPELAEYLRKEYPDLRCIGFDFISIGSWAHKSDGYWAHKEFLTPEEGKREILIIEDMSLNSLDIKTVIERVFAAPLLVENGNGGSITVLAEIKC